MLNYYKNNSCIGNKYDDYKRICEAKTVKFNKSTPASFSGFVYDDKSKPLSGIKLSISRTNIITTTDASGKFELGNVPPGLIDLFVDGRTFNPTNDTTKPQYPSLHFEAYAVKGRDNQIAHPIYLPALSTSPDSVKTVGGNEDVILTIPGLAGFQMKVKANSVTFPDGSRVGTLIVSPVTADKLPMSPPGGAATFGVPAWTIQPAGTRFDPPIEVTLPNYEGRPIGDNIPIVQWDHDLGQFVAMGRATVSEDGSVLVCDSGSGISKAGWGGGTPPPPPPKCEKTPPPPKCNDCQKLEAGTGDCPTGNCVALPDLSNVNSGECCGGNIIDRDKYCCISPGVNKGFISVEKDKPIVEVLPGAIPSIFPNRAQFKGPPASIRPTDLRYVVGEITYAVDGCSTPVNKRNLFPPNLFQNPNDGGDFSLNPMSTMFHAACAIHDTCYQTCKSEQGTCDSALRDNLLAYCNTLSNDQIGSGFFDLAGRTVSLRTECQLSATQMYLALFAAGTAAHNTRQQEMCIACPK